jgi:hypothetical protein
MGHICKDHNLEPLNDEQRHMQEFEADLFAMECLYAIKKGNPRFAPFRSIQMIAICNLLTLMDIEFEASGAALNGYPPFKDRRRTLLDHFEATDDLREAVGQFEEEVKKMPSTLSFSLQS